jgi:hypothetical protein
VAAFVGAAVCGLRSDEIMPFCKQFHRG